MAHINFIGQLQHCISWGKSTWHWLLVGSKNDLDEQVSEGKILKIHKKTPDSCFTAFCNLAYVKGRQNELLFAYTFLCARERNMTFSSTENKTRHRKIA